MDTFGKRLRAARQSHRLTQAELGSLIGVRQNTVAGYESDERQPDLATLVRLAEVLGVSVDFLLGRPAAVRDSSIPFSVTLSLEAQRTRLLHRLSEPGLSLRDRRKILDELAGIEERIAALAPPAPAGAEAPAAAAPDAAGATPPAMDAPFMSGAATQAAPGHFTVIVADDALAGAGIEKGDAALCRTARRPQPGDLVAVRPADSGEIMLRFIIQEGGRWLLRAANPAYADQPWDPWLTPVTGVAVSIVKKAPRLI